MSRLIIDARNSGTTTGRYTDKLVEYLYKLQPDFEVLVLTKTHRLEFLDSVAPNFKIVQSNWRLSGFGEQLGLQRQLKRLGPDLVHFTMPQQPVLYKGKKVTTIHDLITTRFDNPLRNPVIFRPQRQVYRRLIKRVANSSERIIVPSKYVKDDVSRFAGVNPDKIKVIYEAADKIIDQPQPLPRLAGKEFIMYVGRAMPHKNLRRLVDAYAALRKARPELMLVLAGKNDASYHRLGAYVTHMRLAHSVVFTGYITEGELRWLYENTAAYVFPSLSEGFGLPGLEAMAHGAPVVSSNATCLPEIYREAAEYFNPKSTREMAQAIYNVISSPRRAKQLQWAAGAQVRRFSWRHMAEQTLKIYEEVLKNS
ncbi:MAG TPA: glycosyltransferase family 1 protein [Candidatus Saccharimonadales bacterium]|nr:glycosyltransferase family 1 protein [Candidatus Saccharimonadales bacterium]